jgi:COMPASS component SWD1
VFETDPLLVDLHGTAAKRYALPTTLPTLSTAENDSEQAKKTAEYTLVGVFDRTGKYIYTGTSKGHFNVIDAETREVFSLGRSY